MRPMVSVVVPYRHRPERRGLLWCCISQLAAVWNNKRVELIVHETGERQQLQLPDHLGNIMVKYQFTRHMKQLHKAWTFNWAVRNMAQGTKLVLLDADILVSKPLLQYCMY